jgi:hypothetical protein
MNTLFSLEPHLPEGFFYYPDFINAEEEKVLSDEISKIELHNMDYHGYKANRKVMSFGCPKKF